VGIYRLVNKSISKYEGGLVTLGLEAGRDILPSRVKFKEESLAVVHLADSAGLSTCLCPLSFSSIWLTAGNQAYIGVPRH
jgi:hypothetical protein